MAVTFPFQLSLTIVLHHLPVVQYFQCACAVSSECFHSIPCHAMPSAIPFDLITSSLFYSTIVLSSLIARGSRVLRVSQNLKSGSTVLAALVRGSRLWLAWAGDSQAILVRNGQPVTLMRPHKPDSPDERRRIEQAGGCVLFLGALACTPHLHLSPPPPSPPQAVRCSLLE